MAHQWSTSAGVGQVAEETEEDRLSVLPECLIMIILSLLPTKDAVRTSVLAKSWRRTWAGITNLDFSDNELPRGSQLMDSKLRFIRYVHRVIQNCNSLKVSNFVMKCCLRYDQYDVQEWVNTMVLRKEFQKFHIDCYVNGNVAFPDRIFTQQTMVEMKIILPCTLNLPVVMKFGNLKVLFLSKVRLVNGNDSGEMIFDLPGLMDLGFVCCLWRNFEAVGIKARRLLSFQISWCRYELGGRELNKIEKIRIDLSHCTELKRFKSAGYLIEKVILPDPSTVSQALIDHTIESNDYYQNGEVTANLLIMMKSIVHLELSLDSVEAMELVGRFEDLPTFENLTYMKVESRFTSGKRTLLDFLKMTPNLRVLNLYIQSLMWGADGFDQMLDAFLPPCVKMSLEKAHFTCRLRGIVGIGFMRVFLRNAERLELLSFNAPEFEIDLKMRYKEALENAPKASANAIVEVPL